MDRAYESRSFVGDNNDAHIVDILKGLPSFNEWLRHVRRIMDNRTFLMQLPTYEPHHPVILDCEQLSCFIESLIQSTAVKPNKAVHLPARSTSLDAERRCFWIGGSSVRRPPDNQKFSLQLLRYEERYCVLDSCFLLGFGNRFYHSLLALFGQLAEFMVCLPWWDN
jgi:hypothetical protein